MLKTYSLIFFLMLSSLKANWKEMDSWGGPSTDAAFSFVIDGKAYVGGGLNSAFMAVMDPENGTWTSLGSLPFGPRAWAMSFSYQGYGFMIGGDKNGKFEVEDDFWRYDPETDTWQNMGDFPGGKRDGGFAIVVDGNAYVGCGFDGQFLKNDVWKYDIENNEWTQMGIYPGGSFIFPSAFELNGEIYVGAGSQSNVEQEVFYKLDPVSNDWEQVASYPGEARQAGISFTYDGKAYFGGGNKAYTTYYKDFWEYDPNTDKWELAPELEFPTTETAWGVQFVINDILYFGLGADLNIGFNDEFYRYNFNPKPEIQVNSDGL